MEFTGKELRGAEFRNVDLTGAVFRAADLCDVRMRAVDVSGMDVDAPWLVEGTLIVNGVDVVPLVEAELNRRFPGRSQRYAKDPAGLRAAWTALEGAWDAAVEQVPADRVDESVNGEWSFAQTVRHLVLATDMWLGKAVLGLEQPFHPLGLLDTGSAKHGGHDLSAFAEGVPAWEDVLAARASRVAMMRDYLAGVTAAELDEPRANPHGSSNQESVRQCLHTILEESWEHLRYALRDLGRLPKTGGD